MKKSIVITVAMCLLVLGTTAMADATAPLKFDLTLGGVFYSPSMDYYNWGGGAEIQGRMWANEYIGAALSVGLVSWGVDDTYEYYSVRYNGQTFNVIDRVESDRILSFPLGVSLLVRAINNDKVALIFEGGIRYVIVESDVYMSSRVVGVDHLRAKADIDNGFVATLGAELDVKVSSNISLLFGLGYQFDLDKGDVTWMGDKIEENELQSFIAKLGLAFQF